MVLPRHLQEVHNNARSIASLKERCMGKGLEIRAQSPKVSISQIRKRVTGDKMDRKTPRVRAFSTDHNKVEKETEENDKN